MIKALSAIAIAALVAAALTVLPGFAPEVEAGVPQALAKADRLDIRADVLDRHHMLVLGGIEHDDALGRTAGSPDTFDRTADQLALVGHQHDLVAILDRERRHQLAVAVIHRHRDDALAAASGGPVLDRGRALAIAVFADGQHELFVGGHFDIALLAEFDGA